MSDAGLFIHLLIVVVADAFFAAFAIAINKA